MIAVQEYDIFNVSKLLRMVRSVHSMLYVCDHNLEALTRKSMVQV